MVSWKKLKNAIEWVQLTFFLRDFFVTILSLGLARQLLTRLREKGVPIANIAELLGHSGLAKTLRYAHVGRADLARDVALIEVAQQVPQAATTERVVIN